MDLIKKIAEDFVKYNICDGAPDQEKVVNDVRNKLFELHDEKDKVKYLNIVIEGNKMASNSHRLVCQNENCNTDFAHEYISYFLESELKKLGVSVNEDSFTSEDKSNANLKLEKIIEEIQTLKNGQQIIYDQVISEIEELRNLYYLGKKKWYRQYIGTMFEMTVSGMVSETVSKSIVESIKNNNLPVIFDAQ